MNKPQKALVTAAIVVLAGATIYEAYQAAQFRNQVQTLQQQQKQLADEIQQLQGERDNTTNRLAAIAGEIAKNDSKLPAAPTPKPSKPQLSASEAADIAAFEQVGRKMKEANSDFAVEGILLQMKQRLNLTSEQETGIREILKRDSVPRLNKHKAELEALMTSDQQAAYGQFEQETQHDKDRLSASQAALDVLINLQANVGLSQEQQDKAFPALLEYGQQKASSQ
jgi:hypothetical protein